MAAKLFGGDVSEAKRFYEEVRSNDLDTQWVTYRYEGNTLELGGNGENLDDLFSKTEENFNDNDRVYAYVRFETGDEMSRRAKFAFITWIGPAVSVLKKGKVSTDKAFVKQVFVEFGKEFLCDTRSELSQSKMLKDLEKASGAAYGTGR
ncbi:coactosin-like protein [Dysidea avara]|uniref:coactosin-like protein n=1 Tax=Dysidea avara TaxID=196820 RepID=UPI0033201CA3